MSHSKVLTARALYQGMPNKFTSFTKDVQNLNTKNIIDSFQFVVFPTDNHVVHCKILLMLFYQALFKHSSPRYTVCFFFSLFF